MTIVKKFWYIGALAIFAAVIAVWQVILYPLNPCGASGAHALFVATFDADSIGSPLSPPGPLVYGPDDAALRIFGPASFTKVVPTHLFWSTGVMGTACQEGILGNVGDPFQMRGRDLQRRI